MRNYKTIIFLLMLVLFIWFAVSLGIAKSPRHILLLSSYHPGYNWNKQIVPGILSVLGDEIDLVIEYMGSERKTGNLHYQKLYELYQHNFEDTQFDVIITTDNEALEFLFHYRDLLFPGTPVVFCGVNKYEGNLLKNYPLYTGVAENIDIKGTLNAALVIQPNTQHVLAVVDRSTRTGQIIRSLLDETIHQFEDRLIFNVLETNDFATVFGCITALPENSIVLLMNPYLELSGSLIPIQRSTDMITHYSTIPVFSMWDTFLGYGIVGGVFADGFSEGKAAANMALSILQGKPVEDLPVINKGTNSLIFDYNQLERLNIPLNKLPEESVIINKPVPFYIKYRKWVWATILILVFFNITIFFLILGIRTKSRAETLIRQNEDRLKLALEVSNTVLWDWDIIKGNLTFIDNDMEKTIQYDTWEQSIHPEDREQIINNIKMHLLGYSDDYRAEYRILSKSAQWQWVFAAGKVVDYDSQNVPVRMTGIQLDITERKLLERKVLEVSRNERRKIGQDLHDGLGQDLTGIAFLAKALERKLLSKSAQEAGDISTISSLVKQSILKTKNLARGLCPNDAESENLPFMLEKLLLMTSETFGIKYSFKWNQSVLIADNLVITQLYYIAQEALHNSIQHGKADSISISLYSSNGKVILEIRDNGIGIPNDTQEGLGLQSMKYRAELIGAQLNIKKGIDEGTIVSCIFNN
jgi:signal transduction histidine kinase/ABC-type uncharacterized transport system substrate-binding protein